ncbi:nuclease-related domain-containing protein [Thermomonas sp. HDW16]|uniref:nuclease-related domain-containing protein n=1 Tax=Thermomonas sp. HDW16 TaxID=2714945 RepID=UPI001408497D|nr:nuclease-related domain-containing protein [Thermomonas sp. HDW16]QIL19797.1 NERD domain-containing protein [Thermomonas sp. HDW16]
MKSLLPAIILLALIFIPVGLVVATVLLQKRADKRSERRSPINEKLLHQAGSQARKKADALGDDLMERLMQVMLIGPMVMLVILLPRVNWSKLQFHWINWLVLVGALCWVLWLAWRILRLRTDRVKWLEGMRAEMAAAQQLDRLQAQDCYVLHDIPAKDCNIDHVVVGPHAVFMVETKSRRKPGQGKASANMTYDGKALQFPGWSETKPLEQARAQASWLSDYLRGETGEPVPVVAVVCLPGWYVQSGKEAYRSDVRVINPKMTALFIDAGNRPLLADAQRNRIVNALQKQYPEIEQ